MDAAPTTLPDYLARVPDWRVPTRIRQRLTKLIKLTDTLPETLLIPFGDRHLGFRVRKKTFAYFLNEHHDDGIICITCKSTLARQQSLIKRDPKRYCIPAYLGPSGWISLRMDLTSFDHSEAGELLTAAYLLQAPTNLAKAITTRPEPTSPEAGQRPSMRQPGAKRAKGEHRPRKQSK